MTPLAYSPAEAAALPVAPGDLFAWPEKVA